MTRIDYCQQVGIALSTLGRYLRQTEWQTATVRVKLGAATEPRASRKTGSATYPASVYRNIVRH